MTYLIIKKNPSKEFKWLQLLPSASKTSLRRAPGHPSWTMTGFYIPTLSTIASVQLSYYLPNQYSESYHLNIRQWQHVKHKNSLLVTVSFYKSLFYVSEGRQFILNNVVNANGILWILIKIVKLHALESLSYIVWRNKMERIVFLVFHSHHGFWSLGSDPMALLSSAL